MKGNDYLAHCTNIIRYNSQLEFDLIVKNAEIVL